MTEKPKRNFPDDGTDYLLSIDEAASRLRTSRSIVVRLVQAKLLKTLRFRREHRIPKSVLNEFIKEHLGEDVYELLESVEAAA